MACTWPSSLTATSSHGAAAPPGCSRSGPTPPRASRCPCSRRAWRSPWHSRSSRSWSGSSSSPARAFRPPRPSLGFLPVDLRHEAIVLETDRYRIEGKLTLPREGYRSRLSDYVNQRDREFFAINEATLTALDAPDDVRHVSFLMVARRHVRMVTLAAEESFATDDSAPAPPARKSPAPRATKRTTGSA